MQMMVKNIIGNDYNVNLVWWVMHCRVITWSPCIHSHVEVF